VYIVDDDDDDDDDVARSLLHESVKRTEGRSSGRKIWTRKRNDNAFGISSAWHIILTVIDNDDDVAAVIKNFVDVI